MPAEKNVQNITNLLDRFTKTVVDYRGRIYVPKKIRKALGIREGDTVYIEQEEDCFKVYTSRSLGR